MSERSRAVLLTVVALILVGSLLALVLSHQRFESGSTTTTGVTTQSLTSPGYTWLRGADLPTPRAETAAVLVGNEAYVIGGFDATGMASAKVEVYNTTSHTWRTANALPVALPPPRPARVNRTN